MLVSLSVVCVLQQLFWYPSDFSKTAKPSAAITCFPVGFWVCFLYNCLALVLHFWHESHVELTTRYLSWFSEKDVFKSLNSV